MSFWGTGLPSYQVANPNLQQNVWFPPTTPPAHKFALVTLTSSYLEGQSHQPIRQVDVSGFWHELALTETRKSVKVLRTSSGVPAALPLREVHPQRSRLWQNIVCLSHLSFRGKIVLFIFIFGESRAVFKRFILKRDQVRLWF